ncbi:MAG: hypothetical protein ACKVT0_06400 [Planctomycetaceae bacterium]
MRFRARHFGIMLCLCVFFSTTVSQGGFDAGPMILAQASPIPTAPAIPSAPEPSAVPRVQKTYYFEIPFVLLLIVGALTAVCRTSRRS